MVTNIDTRNEPCLTNIRPSVVLKIGGHTIGVVGYLTQDTEVTIFKSYMLHDITIFFSIVFNNSIIFLLFHKMRIANQLSFKGESLYRQKNQSAIIFPPFILAPTYTLHFISFIASSIHILNRIEN